MRFDSHRAMRVVIAGRLMRANIALAAEESTESVEHEHHSGGGDDEAAGAHVALDLRCVGSDSD